MHRIAALLFTTLLCLNASSLVAHELGDSWVSARLQLDRFEANGDFVTHNQIVDQPRKSFSGTFRWVRDGERFFCDIRMNDDSNHRDYRYTCLRDHDRTAICVFSKKLSRGCEIKLFNNDTAAYRNQFSFFPVRLEKGLEDFFPRLVFGALQDDIQLKDGVRGECYSGRIRSEFTLDPAAKNLISSLESVVDGKVVAKQSWKFEIDSNGVAVPKSLARVSGAPGRGGFTDKNLNISSFSLDIGGFAFVFADLDACDSSRMIDQSTDKQIEYAKVTKTSVPNQSIREIFEGSKKAEEGK